MALSSLSEEALVAELQLSLRWSQDVTAPLTARASQLSKMAKDFTAVEEANTHLELEVKGLKEAAEKDKASFATL